MTVPQSIKDSLKATYEGLEAAGFALELDVADEHLDMVISAKEGACEECLVPKTLFIQMVTDELAEGGHSFKDINVTYPIDKK